MKDRVQNRVNTRFIENFPDNVSNSMIGIIERNLKGYNDEETEVIVRFLNEVLHEAGI